MSQSLILTLVYFTIIIPLVYSDTIIITNYRCTITYNYGGNSSAILTQCQYPGGSTNNWNNCQLHCCPSASLVDYPNFTVSVLAICQAQSSPK